MNQEQGHKRIVIETTPDEKERHRLIRDQVEQDLFGHQIHAYNAMCLKKGNQPI